jgi:aryl-alcohol dehydrogenase-like predicted oxidoreductase
MGRKATMKYRQLGRTGLRVSEIGFGAWGISQHEWIGAEDRVSLSTLKAARNSGINFFDTALAYGNGHSERLLAQAFGRSVDVFIASKVPPLNEVWPARNGTPLGQVFPREHVLKSLDQSLANLQRDQVDLYQFHVWNDEWVQQEEWLETVQEMKASGKARAVGLSINDHQPANALKALATGLIDTVQVIYNIFDQSPEDQLFPYCRENNIGVIARVPFDEGSLTGAIRPETAFAPADFRNVYFQGNRKQEVWDHVNQILGDTQVPIEQLPALALRFCISDPAVSTVIPGMRNPARVPANVAVSDAGPLPVQMIEKLRKHRWVRNYYPE